MTTMLRGDSGMRPRVVDTFEPVSSGIRIKRLLVGGSRVKRLRCLHFRL